MKIADMRVGMNNVSVRARVIDKSEVRNVQTRYGPRSVADVVLEDDSGQIIMSLWGEAIDSVSVGDIVNISGAYITQFRDKLQLNVPRKGKIEIVK
jgi:ssDNA-binding replication factor A large subunit